MVPLGSSSLNPKWLQIASILSDFSEVIERSAHVICWKMDSEPIPIIPGVEQSWLNNFVIEWLVIKSRATTQSTPVVRATGDGQNSPNGHDLTLFPGIEIGMSRQ